jgi:hypothetical protein
MFRGMLAQVVTDKGSAAAQAKHSLYDKLEQMSQDGSLHPSLVEWAREIRVIGNAAAHPDALDPVSDDEAADLARLCRQLLDVIYEVPARIARNRAARGSSSLGDRSAQGWPNLLNPWHTTWMQTTGAALLAVRRCSLARVRMPAQDSRSAHGLLYLAAVRDDWREQEHRQGTVDTDPSLVRHGQLVAQCWLPGIRQPDPSLNIGLIPMLLWSTLVVRLRSTGAEAVCLRSMCRPSTVPCVAPLAC